MYIADYHIHSTCSPDGKMTMSQAAEAALRAGLDEICITCGHHLLGQQRAQR